MKVQSQPVTANAATPAESTKLSAQEQAELANVEATIRAGLATFIEVGKALVWIRDTKLYRGEFKTFEAYCAARWNIKKAYAFRLMAAASVVEDLPPIGDKPTTEAQARPLTKLPKTERSSAWQEAQTTAKAEARDVTARDVETAVNKRKNPSQKQSDRAKTLPTVPPPSTAETLSSSNEGNGQEERTYSALEAAWAPSSDTERLDFLWGLVVDTTLSMSEVDLWKTFSRHIVLSHQNIPRCTAPRHPTTASVSSDKGAV